MATVEVESWMEWTDPDNPGFGPGQRQIRFRTKNRPPVFKTCATRDASGGYTVNLNSKGNGYFCSHAVDVNAAIEEALLNAETDLLAMANATGVCEGDCAAVQGFGNAIVNGASAAVELLIGAYDAGDPACDPNNIGGMSPAIKVSAQAPRNPGVDLEPLIYMVNLDAIPGLPTTYRDAAVKFLEDSLEAGCLVTEPFADPASGAATVQRTLSGYSDSGMISVGYFTPEFMSLAITVPADVPGIGNTNRLELYATLSYVTGSWMGGGAVAASGAYAGSDPTAKWGTTTVNAPGLFPSSASFSNDTTPPPREINETIPLINSPDAEVWIPEPSFNGGPTTRLFADDAITIAYSYYRELVDPGFRSKCQYNLHYRYRDPELPICDGFEYWDLVTLPETRYPPGKHPPCTIKTYANYQPPTV